MLKLTYQLLMMRDKLVLGKIYIHSRRGNEENANQKAQSHGSKSSYLRSLFIMWMLHSVAQRITINIFLVKRPWSWDKSSGAFPLKTVKHMVWTFQEVYTWKEIWSVKSLSQSKRLRFVKRLVKINIYVVQRFLQMRLQVFTPWEQKYT